MIDQTRCLCCNHELDSLLFEIAQTGDHIAFAKNDASGTLDMAIYRQYALDMKRVQEPPSPFSKIIATLRLFARQFHPLKDEPLMLLFK